MKKIVSVILFVLSLGIIFSSEYYTIWPFNYHIAEFIGYVVIWFVVLFIVSLFALVLENIKYKKWFSLSVVFTLLSIFIAYKIGDGNGGILSVDGELMTWFLSGLYSFISLIYFIVQFVKNRKHSQIN